jgi:hypothetical protein
MCLLFSLFPATGALALGYLVLVNANKAEGTAHTLGRALAIWLFLLAVFFPVCGAYVTFSGICPIERMFQMS